MKNASISDTSSPRVAIQGGLSERIEARLSTCVGRSESDLAQRNGRSHTVPSSQSVSPLRALPNEVSPQPVEEALRLPGLNGRSVRRLRHLESVRFLRRAIATALAACGAIVAVSLAVPAYAQAIAEPDFSPPLQVLSVSTPANIAMVERDGYSVTAPPPVQWPTALHTKISDGYGARVSPCDGCSSMHLAVDFDAGRGAEVRSMAAGVVVKIGTPATSSLGNFVTIEHEIDGKTIASVYGHLQDASIPLQVGDNVTVGQLVGLVGSTGATTGPHLHFELWVGGSNVNPIVWLRAHIR